MKTTRISGLTFPQFRIDPLATCATNAAAAALRTKLMLNKDTPHPDFGSPRYPDPRVSSVVPLACRHVGSNNVEG